MHRTVHAVSGVSLPAQFGSGGLAKKDHPGIVEALRKRRIVIRHPVPVEQGPPRGEDTLRGGEILERSGDAGQRPGVSRHICAFGANCLFEGVFVSNGDVGIVDGIEPFNPAQQRFRDFDGRELPLQIQIAQFVR